MPRTNLSLFTATLVASLAVLASPLAATSASATTLRGTLTADNAFNAYLGTSASPLATLLTSGNSWSSSYTFSDAALTAGETYFLNVEVANFSGASGNPAGLIGSFSLRGTGFQFANGSQTLNTGVSYWTGGFNASNSNLPQSWVQPSARVGALGANGISPWGRVSGVARTAQWIWPTDARSSPGGTPTASGGECASCVVDFQTEIVPIQTPSAVPEPASLAIFAVAVGGLALAMRRRRRPA